VVTADADPTLDVYEARADEWRREREPRLRNRGHVGTWAGSDRLPGRLTVDLGCGPGWYLPNLGNPAVGVDATAAMLAQVPDFAPGAARVRADLRALPFRRQALGGALASKSYVHVPMSGVPAALADLHRAMAVGAPLELLVFGDPDGAGVEHDSFADDSFAGRRFSLWAADRLRDVVVGAGFEIAGFEAHAHGKVLDHLVRARRARTLADTVDGDMRILVCGLNPSLYAADAGLGFARPGNRFWPAALAAGLVERARDPLDALRSHGVGMTDLVKRATTAAAELTSDEYRAGLERVRRLVGWLQPSIVCFVGLAGWRAAVDRKAVAGLQAEELSGAKVYVMPSTSGLNAATPLSSLTDHLTTVKALAGPAS
jgi:TDG/mug DNA glycosylase family protein